MPTHRHKQIRVQLSVYGTPRLGLGPQKVRPPFLSHYPLVNVSHAEI